VARVSARPRSGTATSSAVVVGLCFLALVLEGYDLLMYGTVVPSLLAYQDWDLDASAVGRLGSAAAFGMLVGALGAAATGDRWGRRRTIMTSITTFSVAMGACAVAPSPEVFGVARFFVGLGAGALMPTAVATLVEFSASDRRTRTAALGFAGVGVGGMLAGLLALWLVPSYGFRGMFWAGCAPLVAVLPLMVRYLPESPSFLLARGRRVEAEAVAADHGVALVERDTAVADRSRGLRALFAEGRTPATLLFWVATFFCLVVLFGVASWLPALMTAAGYGLTSSLSFVLVLNGGAVVGALAASTLADRWGAKPVTALAFGAAAVSLALLAVAPPTWAVYLLVAVAGFGTTGTQILLNAFVALYYPAAVRTTGLGVALGVGRLGAILGPTYGGLLVDADLSLPWQFYAFALPAAAGGVAAALVPLRRAALPTAAEDRPAPAVVH
jgi:MFS transporter, AAHS family, benzoate transport protein